MGKVGLPHILVVIAILLALFFLARHFWKKG